MRFGGERRTRSASPARALAGGALVIVVALVAPRPLPSEITSSALIYGKSTPGDVRRRVVAERRELAL